MRTNVARIRKLSSTVLTGKDVLIVEPKGKNFVCVHTGQVYTSQELDTNKYIVIIDDLVDNDDQEASYEPSQV